MAKKLSLSVVVLFIILFLASCEQLGIEITTVKGSWQSDKLKDGSYITLQLSENGSFFSYSMVTDTTYSKFIKGTWKNEEDSLFLYVQGEKTSPLIIEKLSMNNMTLKDGQRYVIMTRKYNNPNNKYEEVFELKKGFWFYVRGIGYGIVGAFLIGGVIGIVGSGVGELVKWIKNK